jgi:hypothetical protein
VALASYSMGCQPPPGVKRQAYPAYEESRYSRFPREKHLGTCEKLTTTGFPGVDW